MRLVKKIAKISGITIIGAFSGIFIGSKIKSSPAAAGGGNINVILGLMAGSVIGFILGIFLIR